MQSMAPILHNTIESIRCRMRTAIPHILVVDDNVSILESVAMVLRWNALRVTTINDTDDFARDVQLLQPDLIILDKALGWADGCQLCTALKKDFTQNNTRVIMFSAFQHVRQQCLDAGADAFLPKPFDLDDMLQLVRKLTTPVLLPS